MTDPKDLLMTPGPGQAALEKVQQNEQMQDQEQPDVNAGADTLAQPENGVPSGASLGDIDRNGVLKKFRSAMALSPHASKIGNAITKTIAENPRAAAQPGGVMRAVVAGGLQALTGIGDSLGDVAAVGTVPEGAGGLTGMARTLQARNQRMRQQRLDTQAEKKDNALIAETNARTLHTQALVHQLDEEAKDKLIASNQPVLDLLREAGAEYVVAGNKDSNELSRGIQSGTIKPTEHAGVLDGKKDAGDGLTRGTYSIVIPHDVDLDPSNPRQKQVLDLLNEYTPPSKGKTWQGENGSAVHFQGDQFLHLVAQANAAETSTMARNQHLVKQGLETVDSAKKMESIQFEQNLDTWNKALAAVGGQDVIAARNLILRTQPGKWKDLDYDLAQHYKQEHYDKMLDDYQKKITGTLADFEDRRKELTTADGAKSAGLASQWRTEMKTVGPEFRPTLQKLIDEADAKAKGAQDYSVDLKTRESEAEQKASEGDLSSVMDMALKYDYDPDKLFSRFKGQKQKAEFLAEMHRRDPNWSEAEYAARYETKKDYRPQGKGGIAKQSLNAFGGHVGDANSLIETLRNKKSPLLNTPINKWKEEVLGQPQFIAYRQAVQAAGDEYLNFLLNNRAKHKSDDDLVEKMNSTDTSPEAAQGMFRQMANTIAIRARAQNKAYRDQMGENIPKFLDPDTEQVLRTFGIDPKSITNEGPSGLIHNQQKAQNLPPAAKGMVRVQLPSGTFLDYAEGSDAYKQAIANGATAVRPENQ